MGFFGSYVFINGQWEEIDPRRQVHRGELWLQVSIYDSDITTVTYHPAGPGSGTAYLGHTPRSYFESEDASPPTDVEREAAGLTQWWRLAHREVSEKQASLKQSEVIQFLAQDLGSDHSPEADEATDDEDVFVEDKTRRLLTALNLPIPEGLDY